ncbi:hypothetical protein [uncultured Roseobacter sp.]|uniref:hypothetical protein n=1 Tax=uncultured Roseobacter sp. TaxID=114847 RepID=UPI00261562F4|nr:hypothetical protein [uncultured Roseobacter sp.]
MARKSDPREPVRAGAAREDRLKAALKANMARRKAQAQARAQSQGAQAGGSPDAGAEKDA